MNIPPLRITDAIVNVEDAKYVYTMLKDDFHQTRQEWTNVAPSMKVKLSLLSIVDPLWKLSQMAIIIFFPGKLPSANDVGQWVNSLLEGSFVKGVYFASRGFYEVHLLDAKQAKNAGNVTCFMADRWCT